MSKIKEFYHDQICEGLEKARLAMEEDAEHDISYHTYLSERAKEFGIDAGPLPLSQEMIDTISAEMVKEDKMLEELAEQYEFESIIRNTNMPPC